jgi:LacI family trehalose operon transcriptional repressor
MKQGYEQVASVLTPQTTALVCATDTLALGASKYLQEQRIDVCRWRASAARR